MILSSSAFKSCFTIKTSPRGDSSTSVELFPEPECSLFGCATSSSAWLLRRLLDEVCQVWPTKAGNGVGGLQSSMVRASFGRFEVESINVRLLRPRGTGCQNRFTGQIARCLLLETNSESTGLPSTISLCGLWSRLTWMDTTCRSSGSGSPPWSAREDDWLAICRV